MSDKPVPNPRFGEIWDVWLDPAVGREQGGRRPALVISSDVFNDVPHELRIVVPATSVHRSVPSHIPVEPPAGGLVKPSVLMCEQARSVSILRCRKRRGVLEPEIVQAVQAMVGRFLNLKSALEARDADAG